MTPNEYQALALRTWVPKATPFMSMSVLALGLTGESGEVADHIKKVIGHGHKMEYGKVLDELGDILWYLTVMAAFCGYTLEDVMSNNILKLKKRYPEGFSMERSINRE